MPGNTNGERVRLTAIGVEPGFKAMTPTAKEKESMSLFNLSNGLQNPNFLFRFLSTWLLNNCTQIVACLYALIGLFQL